MQQTQTRTPTKHVHRHVNADDNLRKQHNLI